MKKALETMAVHTSAVDPATGAASFPVYHASTFHQEAFDQEPAFTYSRSANPTRAALERLVAELEGGHAGFAFASGMAAITAVFLTLSAGDHVVATQDIYGGTFRALTQEFRRFGITTSFVDTTDLDAVADAIGPTTRLLYLETPSNPTLRITDLRAASDLAHRRGVAVAADNTFATPYLQQPHQWGVDVVIHSATKFLGGHSDLVGGVVSVIDDAWAQRLKRIQNGFGAILGPQDCWLMMRGIRTLGARMRAGQESAGRIAEFLAQHPAVRRVYYPGLPEHPGAAIHAQQARGPGAVLSFDVGSVEAVQRLVERLHLPLYAVSLGGVETIVSYPARMSHASMPLAERQRLGIGDGLLRLSAGLEAVDDLLADLEQALAGV